MVSYKRSFIAALIGALTMVSASALAQDLGKMFGKAMEKAAKDSGLSSSEAQSPKPLQTPKESPSQATSAIPKEGKTAQTAETTAPPAPQSKATNNAVVFSPSDSTKAMPWIARGAEQACKGDRWLGTENGYDCGVAFLDLCDAATNILGHQSPNGCPSNLPKQTRAELGWLNTGSDRARLQKPIEKEAILNSAPQRADIDKKLAYVEKACTEMFPKLESSSTVVARWNCYGLTGAAALGSDFNVATNKVTECKSSYLTADLATYCQSKLISWMQQMQAKLAPLQISLAKTESESYMLSGAAAQAKKKLDEVIASGDRKLDSLKGWCNRLYGPLELKKEEFLPKCEAYVTLKLDSMTGGQASKTAAADELTSQLSLIYFTHMHAHACYDARKEFQVQYVTAGQLEQATKDRNSIEADLVKRGAQKDAALKHANSEFAPFKTTLSASQNQFTESGKRTCTDAVRQLRMLAPAGQ
jgi:hypothetical protein